MNFCDIKLVESFISIINANKLLNEDRISNIGNFWTIESLLESLKNDHIFSIEQSYIETCKSINNPSIKMKFIYETTDLYNYIFGENTLVKELTQKLSTAYNIYEKYNDYKKKFANFITRNVKRYY